jgi:hypothetical protein
VHIIFRLELESEDAILKKNDISIERITQIEELIMSEKLGLKALYSIPHFLTF